MAAPAKLVPGSTGNLFLDSLSESAATCLVAKLERIAVPVNTVIAHIGVPIEQVVFPLNAVVSAVAMMRDGSGVEVTLIGREGFYGLPVALGENVGSEEAMVQLADSVLALPSAAFAQCLRDEPTLLPRVLRYAQATIATISQFSACNRLHAVNERCARWLLMAHDRVPTDEIFLTHEYLATMLGVRRPQVSLAAAALDEAGFIRYRRGRIVVLDRTGLEGASCECYFVAHEALERMLGYGIRKGLSTDGAVRTGPSIRLQTD